LGQSLGISWETAFSTEDANDAQRAIDQQLATLLDKVCLLRQWRNAFAPISRLPPEILCRIFEIARDTDHIRHRRPEVCVTITHVCSAWRDIAMRFPGLWSRITPSYHLNWVEAMMLRSGTAPLRIHVDPGHKLYTLPTILSDATVKRLQELAISGLHFPALALKMHCPSMFDCYAPLLERFNITFASPSFDARSDDVMLDRLFSKGTPHLRHLTMKNCLLPCTSLMFRSPLTFLRLALSHDSDTSMLWTVDQLADVLENLPTLETLELHNVIPTMSRPFAPPAPASALRTIALPRLAKLSIVSHTFSQCSLLLDRLAMIPSSYIHLECSTHDEPLGRPLQLSFSSLSDLLKLRNGANGEAISIHSAEWSFDRTSFMALALWRETQPTFEMPFLQLVLPVYAPNLLVIPNVLTALPLEGLNHISFFRDFPQAWMLALALFERVTSVFVQDIRPGAGIISALARRTLDLTSASSREGSRSQLFFQALSTLTISECSLLDDVPDHGQSLFQDLYAMLETRRNHGHRLATLRFTACELTENQLMKLRQVVDTVICDKEKMNTIVIASESPDSDDADR